MAAGVGVRSRSLMTAALLFLAPQLSMQLRTACKHADVAACAVMACNGKRRGRECVRAHARMFVCVCVCVCVCARSMFLPACLPDNARRHAQACLLFAVA